MNFRILLLLIAFTILPLHAATTTPAEEIGIPITATIQENPPKIWLRFPKYNDPTYPTTSEGIVVHRKFKGAGAWGTGFAAPGYPMTDPADSAYWIWEDSNAHRGVAYEYQVTRKTTVDAEDWPGMPTHEGPFVDGPQIIGYGYIATGIRVYPIDQRGRLILVVESGVATTLATELNTFRNNLRMDGWTVATITVSSTASPATVKWQIQTAYNQDKPNTKAVFLFGKIAAPFSGNIYPDGHMDHWGAHPADMYYGDMDGTWTDTTVDSRNNDSNPPVAGIQNVEPKPKTKNIPGDGNFDQSSVPSGGSPYNTRVELAVGRVDFSNMITFWQSGAPVRTEIDLLRQYLDKNDKFRRGEFTALRRGVIADRQGVRYGTAPVSMALRHFKSFFGNNAIDDYTTYDQNGNPSISTYKNYAMDTLTTSVQPWLWSSVTSTSDDFRKLAEIDSTYTDYCTVFAKRRLKAVFTTWSASYIGDWDRENAFLMAPLGSSDYCLVSIWGGRPYWPLHHLAQGETIGHSLLLAQNNTPTGLYRSVQNMWNGMSHISLLGDPTLRMHVIMPIPTNPTATVATGGKVTVDWSTSTSPDVNIANLDEGYLVYRGTSPDGPFERLGSASPVRALSFVDFVPNGTYYYVVKATRIEGKGNRVNASGTYINTSLGKMTAQVVVNNAPTWTLTIVPTFGGYYSTLSAVNGWGYAVGSAHESYNSYDGINLAYHAFRYTTSATRLGYLNHYSENGYTAGINNYNWVAGHVRNSNTGPDIPVRWNDTGLAQALQTLGSSAYPTAINDAGVIVGYAQQTSGPHRAVRWEPGGTGLWNMGGFTTTGHASANGLNAAGRICGYAINSANKSRGFLTPISPVFVTTAHDIGTMAAVHYSDPAHTASVAHDVSDPDGSGVTHLVGDTTVWGGETHAFIKNANSGLNAGFVDLDTLGGAKSVAYGMNNARWVVGTSDIHNGDYRAFFHRPGATRLLNLNLFNPQPGTFEIREAFDISENGLPTIIGWGYFNGSSRGYIMRQN